MNDVKKPQLVSLYDREDDGISFPMEAGNKSTGQGVGSTRKQEK
jgi:hypothetical protein